jgi:transaldolase
MAIFIDSAVYEEVREALSARWIGGVTTNPLLLAEATEPPEMVLKRLVSLNPGEIFYQLMSTTQEEMLAEARQARLLVGEALVLKLAPIWEGFSFAARYASDFRCCVTAVYSPAQALAARHAGAQYVAIYVNRATQLGIDGIALVQDIARILESSSTGILAASLKTPEQASQAFKAGAAHLTMPLAVLKSLTANPFSDETVDDFLKRGVGIPI